MSVIFACDYSGSTGNSEFYWNNVQKLVLQQPEDTVFYLWDTYCTKVSRDDMLLRCTTKKGNGGTDTHCVAKQLPENVDKLVLITDGQVGDSAVKQTGDFIRKQGINIKTCEIYFITTGGRMNLSVALPFSRTGQYTMHIHEKDSYKTYSGNLNEFTDWKEYEDPEYFLANLETFRRNFVMVAVGSSNTQYRDRLLKLKKVLLNNVANKNLDTNGLDTLYKLLFENKLQEAYVEARRFVEQADMTTSKRIETEIMSMCKAFENNDYSFSQLESGLLRRAAQTEEVPADECEFESSDYVCPITMDNASPCILIANGTPLLEGLEKSKVDMYITNPLYFLCDRDLVDRLKERLDFVTGHEALQLLCTNGFKSPVSFRPLIGAIVTGSSQDHVKANNWTMAQLFFGKNVGKLAGQSDLWQSVVYLVAKQLVYMDEAVPALEDHLRYRFRHNKTTISLSGLPEFPLQKVPVEVALWYCASSPRIHHDNIPQNRLRAMPGVAEYILQLLDLVDMPYEKDWCRVQVNTYRVFGYLMSKSHSADELEQLRKEMRSLYQDSIRIDDHLVLLDGPVEERVDTYRGLKIKEIAYLLSLVDPSKKISAIELPDFTTLNVPEVKEVINYPYLYNNDKPCTTQICEATMRPWSIDPVTGEDWKVAAEHHWGVPVNQQISLRRIFIDTVVKYGEFPTMKQMILGAERRQKLLGIDTLPKSIVESIQEVFTSYKKVGFYPDGPVSVQEFINRTRKSVERDKRRQIELNFKATSSNSCISSC